MDQYLSILIKLAERYENDVKQALIETEGIDPNLIRDLEAGANGVSLFNYIINNNKIDQETVTRATAKAGGWRYVNLSDDFEISPDALALIPAAVARDIKAIPFARQGQDSVGVALADPSDVQSINTLRHLIGFEVVAYIASPKSIETLLRQTGISLASLSQQVLATKPTEDRVTAIDTPDLTTSDSVIATSFHQIVRLAINYGASDIHIEPIQNQIRIRLRIDGVLKQLTTTNDPNQATQKQLISRIKILSNLKTDQTRLPQDGQFIFFDDGKEIYLRVATTPVAWGEKVILRILNKSSIVYDIAELGYVGRTRQLVEESVRYSDGIVLTSGPTGSGKTTSMYSLISKINKDNINIVTLEQPIEYKIPGINQIEINESIGLTFESGLRSVLRHDPDCILVGEIRDQTTANLAIQAAMTGHLVFSTIHTNSAAGILPRLINMGVEPFLVASTVRLVISQRLVRRIRTDQPPEKYPSNDEQTNIIQTDLSNCLPTSSMDEAEIDQIESELGYGDLPLLDSESFELFRGEKSEKNDDGYDGRVGIYEAFRVTDRIQELIEKNSLSTTIERAAMEEGMLTLRQDGLIKALKGVTTIDEINRVNFTNFNTEASPDRP